MNILNYISRSFIVVALCVILNPSRQATAEVLLHDTFTVDGNNTNVNIEIAERQSGLLGPVTYTDGGEPVFSQVDNLPDGLLMAGRAGGTTGRISLDHNFTEPIAKGGSFVIEFDVNPLLGVEDDEANPFVTSWIAIHFGGTLETRNQFPQQNDGVTILFRGNGIANVWDAGSVVPIQELRFSPGVDDKFHHIRIVITDVNDGNPFDNSGHPVSIEMFVDHAEDAAFSHIRSRGFAANYFSIIGEGEGGAGGDVITHGLDELVFLHLIPQAPLDNIQAEIQQSGSPSRSGLLFVIAGIVGIGMVIVVFTFWWISREGER